MDESQPFATDTFATLPMEIPEGSIPAPVAHMLEKEEAEMRAPKESTTDATKPEERMEKQNRFFVRKSTCIVFKYAKVF